MIYIIHQILLGSLGQVGYDLHEDSLETREP